MTSAIDRTSAPDIVTASFRPNTGQSGPREIVGSGILANGDTHAVLLIPCDEGHPDTEGCDYSPAEASTVAATHATETQKQLTSQEISRMRNLLMNRHRGFMPRTMH